MNITKMIRPNIIIAELYKIKVMLKKNYFRLFDITVWPIILFFSLVLFLKFISPAKEIMSMVITGLIGWRAVYHMQIETNLGYMDDHWRKNLAHMLASPIKISEFISAHLISGFIKFIFVLGIYLILAYSFFSFHIADISKFMIGISYLLFTGITLGLIVLGFIILYKDKAITFSFALPDLFVLLSGAYYPISIFPDLVIKFVHILPTFYGFELLKSMVGLGSVDYIGMIIVGSIWFIASILFLKYCIKRAKRTGELVSFN